MLGTWIETAAKGRLGGPVRAGMWSSVVLGTHPIETEQDVWLEISADDLALGPLPAYWVENKGVNSLWHVPVPPQAVGARLHYRSAARRAGSEPVFSNYQDTVVRPNLPDRTESAEVIPLTPEGLVGNRMMTVKVDARGSTYDIYFPTVGLHSDVRPAEGDLPQSRSHFRAIVGGLAVGLRLDWFTELLSWESFQHYQGATNLLTTELNWRNGPI
ncbi:MAG: glycosyl hydrolase, partial [Planctomycetia bacterium]|nr:glycosyl hydrolase [Planctomycetia bacterium]